MFRALLLLASTSLTIVAQSPGTLVTGQLISDARGRQALEVRNSSTFPVTSILYARTLRTDKGVVSKVSTYFDSPTANFPGIPPSSSKVLVLAGATHTLVDAWSMAGLLQDGTAFGDPLLIRLMLRYRIATLSVLNERIDIVDGAVRANSSPASVANSREQAMLSSKQSRPTSSIDSEEFAVRHYQKSFSESLDQMITRRLRASPSPQGELGRVSETLHSQRDKISAIVPRQ